MAESGDDFSRKFSAALVERLEWLAALENNLARVHWVVMQFLDDLKAAQVASRLKCLGVSDAAVPDVTSLTVTCVIGLLPLPGSSRHLIAPAGGLHTVGCITGASLHEFVFHAIKSLPLGGVGITKFNAHPKEYPEWVHSDMDFLRSRSPADADHDSICTMISRVEQLKGKLRREYAAARTAQANEARHNSQPPGEPEWPLWELENSPEGKSLALPSSDPAFNGLASEGLVRLHCILEDVRNEAKTPAPADGPGGATTEQTRAAPAPASEPTAAYLSPSDLASKNGVGSEKLRKRLERWRRAHDAGYVEASNPAAQGPRYLYSERAVQPIIDALKSGRQSSGRK
jgi:hypothetical protein